MGKKVEFLGQTYSVPDWVEYVARDNTGEIWGYENEPKKLSYQFSSINNRVVFIAEATSGFSTRWSDTLTKVGI